MFTSTKLAVVLRKEELVNYITRLLLSPNERRDLIGCYAQWPAELRARIISLSPGPYRRDFLMPGIATPAEGFLNGI